MLVGGHLTANCLKLSYLELFWVFLGLFGSFWMILGEDVPVLVGGHLTAKCLYLPDFTCFGAILVLFGCF